MKSNKQFLAVPLLLRIGFLAVYPQSVYGLFGFGDIVF
jgi:hypothetical protein